MRTQTKSKNCTPAQTSDWIARPNFLVYKTAPIKTLHWPEGGDNIYWPDPGVYLPYTWQCT